MKEDVDYASRLLIGYRFPNHARKIYDIIRDHQKERVPVIVLATVEALKSTILDLCMIQDLLEPDCHILLGTKAKDVRDRHSTWLRDSLKVLHGGEGQIWQDKKFTVPGWDSRGQNPSWFGATPGMSIEGMRGDKVYEDDPIDQDSWISATERKKAIQWRSFTFIKRMNTGGHETIVGSPWHPEDYYADLIGLGFECHAFPMRRAPCPDIWKAYKNVHWHGKEYPVLWEKWKRLDFKEYIRTNGGPIAFEQRNQCNPEAIRGQRFKTGWFHYYDNLSETVKARLIIETGVDPAISKSQLADNTSYCTIGHDHETDLIYVLENHAGKWNFIETQEHLISVGERRRHSRMTIEDTAYQKALIDQLQHDTRLPIVAQKAIQDKVSRIDTLAVPISQGKILFKKGAMHELIHEFLYFPNGSTDDRIDSLEVAVRHILGGRVRRNKRIRTGGRR